jgi:hypothetical protein
MSSADPSSSDVERFATLFRGNERAHGTHGVPEKDPNGLKWTIKSTARTVREPVTPALWRQHLEGARPLGVIPIRDDSTCSWGSIDFDLYDDDLLAIIARVEASKMPLVPCRSKSNGLHLFLFLQEPEPAADVQMALREAAAVLNMPSCEIFPKQTHLSAERHDLGNWIIVPYFGGDFDGKLRMQYGLKRSGAEMTLREFLAKAESARTTVSEFTKRCKGPGAAPSRTRKVGQTSESKLDFSNGPPCLQTLAGQEGQPDGRRRTLFMIAVYFKRSNPGGWEQQVDQANHRFSPPLSSQEVVGVIKSVTKKDYQYTCKEEPMRSHCNSALCRTRKFGVGDHGNDFIDGITKIESDQPLYHVHVGDKTIDMSLETITKYSFFKAAYFQHVNRMPPNLKNAEWEAMLTGLMEAKYEPAPAGVNLSDQFKELLEEHLTNRMRGDRREDLLGGRPWQDEDLGRYYFRMNAFRQFLAQQKALPFYTEAAVKLGQRVRELGGDVAKPTISRRAVHVWWVPVGKITPAPVLEPPLPRKEEI